MITEIIWTDEYTLGVEEIDVQHKHLVGLVNRSIKKGNGYLPDVKTGDLLGELERYTRWHFSCEEEFMRIYEYSRYQDHKDEHDILMESLMEKAVATLSGSAPLGMLNDFLFGWFGGHAFGYDQEMAEFMIKTWDL